MVDPAQEVRFHWLAADGARLSGSEQELRAALTSGALSPSTLVWRKGWAEWLAANRVAELASSIPEASRSAASEPRRDASTTNPPAVRLSGVAPRPTIAGPTQRPSSSGLRAPQLVPPAKPALSNRPAKPTAQDTLAPSSFGTLGPTRRPSDGPARRESGPPPPPQRGRAPLPTLGEEQGVISATATLRPPGAVPPPARGAPVPAFDSSPRASATMTPIPAFGPVGGKLETPRPAPLPPPVAEKPAVTSAEAALDSTLEVPLPVLPAEARRTPVPVTPVPVAPAAVSALPARRAPQDSLVKIGRIGVDSRTVVMALSALSGALLVAVLGLAWSHSRETRREPELLASASAALPRPAPAVVGCRVALPAARIAPSIERSVPPYATRVTDGTLALGIAASKTRGVGLRLDPSTLDVTPAFEEEGKDAVRGVVPLTRSSALTFFVDRDDKVLRSAHTIDEAPPFTLGLNDAGFSRVLAGSTALEWPLEADAKITEPRTAAVGDFGYGVTFRRGGQTGSVLLGFVARDGSKKTDLVAIPGAPPFLGTPVIAGSNSGVWVVFAGRDASDAPWKLFVSQAAAGQAPSPARALITGSGGGAISPALSALDGDRWLVQWTEGSSGQYHVHVQSFSSAFAPIGQPVLVSPKGANAGQGSLVTSGDGAASLFILTTAGHDELWGATLACQ